MKSFKNQYTKAIENITDDFNKSIVNSMSKAYNMAVITTPAPPTPSYQEYKRTGRLRYGWNVSLSKSAIKTPKMGKYSFPSKPNIKFDINKDRYIQLYNNVPYAWFVEHGKGKNQHPRLMLAQATIAFKKEIKK